MPYLRAKKLIHLTKFLILTFNYTRAFDESFVCPYSNVPFLIARTPGRPSSLRMLI